jgi:hypothetical protein
MIIFIGSIHLGWHYAVDGIFSAIGMWAIWKAVNWWCVYSRYDDASFIASASRDVAK